MRRLLILLFLLSCQACLCQDTTFRWNLSLNPFAVLEPQSAYGFGLGYRVSSHFELWTEASLLRGDLLHLGDYSQVKGYRQIGQIRYYWNEHFFCAGELRWKRYSMLDSQDFVNAALKDTLVRYVHTSVHTFGGAAFLFGLRQRLGSSHFFLELEAGLGLKDKRVTRKNIPAGYDFYLHYVKIDTPVDIERDVTVPYLPCALRLFYRF